MSNLITNKWVNIPKPTAFSGIDTFYYSNKGKTIPKDALKNEHLPSIPTYQKFKQYKKPRTQNTYYVYKRRHLIQADLLHMLHPSSLIQDNNGFGYILVVQDCFSRKIWVKALKDKKASTLAPILNIIFQDMHPFMKDARFVIDRGTEFLNKQVKEIISKYGMQVIHTSDSHASFVERAILSLQRLLYQQMSKNGGKNNWIDFLIKAAKTMNSRYHRIIKTSPNQADLKKNEKRINEAMSIYRQKQLNSPHKKRKIIFSVNDYVRIYKWKDKFTRGYKQSYSTEIFKIYKIVTKFPVTMYTLIDLENNIIRGNFYASQLSKVMGDTFLVEKILKRKIVSNIPMVYVKWEGFPSSYNSWIQETAFS